MSSKRDVKKSKEIIQISETARSHEHRHKVAFKKTTVDPNDPNNREVIYLDIHSFDDDVTPIEILLILREFDDAASMLGWTNGPKLFNNFQLLVTGSTLASDEWTKAAAQANTMTVATFTVARQSFLSELMKPIKYTSQIDYLRKLKKPRDMELIEFKRNFETSNKLLAKYPDANGATGLDADEFKRTFYNALPYSWRDKFRITGKREENVTFDEILEHMLAIESVEPSSESGTNVSKKTRGSNNGSGNNGNSGNTHQTNSNNSNNNSSGNNRRGRRGGRGNGNNNSNSNGNGGNNGRSTNNRIRPGDTCPLPGHSSHIWYQCHSNAHGRHGDNSRCPEGQAGESNVNEQDGEQHFVDDIDGSVGSDSGGQFDYLYEEDEMECYLCQECVEDDDEESDDDEPPPLVPRAYIQVSDSEDEDSDDEDDSPPAFDPVAAGYSKSATAIDAPDRDPTVQGLKDVTTAEILLYWQRKAIEKSIAKYGPDPNEAAAEQKPESSDDVKTSRSGPLNLSYGAFGMFQYESLLNGGVDNVLSNNASLHFVPTTLASARKINDRGCRRPLKTLIDHGASHSIINKRSLPRGLKMEPSKSVTFNTTAGKFNTSNQVLLKDFRLPEFNRNRSVDEVKCSVFDSKSVKYDLILGRDFLNAAGIDVKSSTLTCEWCGDSIPFKPPSFITDSEAHDAFFASQNEPKTIVDHESHATFTATKSTFVEIDDVIDQQTHLTQSQREQLLEVLSRRTKLFSGKLGCYPHRKFHIDLKPNTVPYHCKAPYPVPASQRKIVKAEIDRQVRDGILERVNESLWGMPMLCISKKDGAIRTVDDMRKLNECILRRVYPLPRLLEMMRRHYDWAFITILDLTLCYYSYELDEESSWYCVLVTPFGKYRRLRLSMGLAQSPDWAQAALEEVLQEELHDFIEAYIDDVAIFSKT